MRKAVEWLIVVVAGLLIVGLIAYARGPEHHHGDEIGSDGSHVVVVQIVP